MLCIHILNVGRGDSLILEHHSGAERSFAVIDSHQYIAGDPPALRKLRELGAERLSFVALTHPHADHYKGLSSILRAYRGNVGAFFTFPLFGHVRQRIGKYAKLHRDVASRSDSPTVLGRAVELVSILNEAKNHIGLDNWQEQTGPMNKVFVEGFPGVDIHTILPPAKVKSRLFSMLDADDATIAEDSAQELNNLSLAFLLEYGGQRVILGGDGPYANWIYHKQIFGRHARGLNARAVKIPHHGSHEDCKQPVLDYLFQPGGNRYACISADGHRHPHPELYAWLKDRGILPYCTNLAKSCGAKVRGLIPTPGLDPTLSRFVNAVADDPTPHAQMPCQGDIKVCISVDGEITTTPQYNHPCPYRGGYDFVQVANA